MRLLLAVFLIFSVYLQATETQELATVPLSSVRLTDGPFLHSEQTNLKYLLALDANKLLAPLRREAGIENKVESYGNWENTGLDGHMLGHYLTALAFMFSATANEQIKARLDYSLTELQKIQQAQQGYLGGVPGSKALWQQIRQGQIEADLFSLNKHWVPFYNIHKTFAGLRDIYLHTGDMRAKTLLLNYGNWLKNLVKNLSPQQIQQMLLTEHGGMNEVLADMAVIFDDNSYMALAKDFTELRILEPLLKGEDKLTGLHANTQIPKVVGIARIAELSGDKNWLKAAEYFWSLVVEQRTVAIGGNSVREHFHPKDDFNPMLNEVEGPETCNTYNMLKLSMLLYRQTGQSKYLDYYERGLWNHILASQHPEHGGFVYFTPMRPQHYRVYSKVDQGMWCCVGSGIESHSKHGEFIYSLDKNALQVNLWIASSISTPEIKLHQQTLFPDENSTELVFDAASQLNLQLRYPSWAGAVKVWRNGQAVQLTAKAGEHIVLAGPWQQGDRVKLELPMQLSLDPMPAKPDYHAVLYGPIVLASRSTPFKNESLNFVGDDSRMGHIASGPTCPVSAAPLYIGDTKNFLASLKRLPNQPLGFSTGQGFLQGKPELIPFFRLHDSRYQIYFQHTSLEGWQQQKALQEQQDKAAALLEQQTLDKVYPGEQQPESDHFYQGEQSEAGINLGRHWRHSKSWFSYQLSHKGQQNLTLRLEYFGLDGGRAFEVWLDDKKLTDVELKSGLGPDWYQVDYPIPNNLLPKNAAHFRVKFVAKPGSIAGGLYQVRLLKL
ncbi:MAG TPA: beta-L-arabinofuranosidase domain-containing protein [Rheinheimera sp.]|uniref:beta-L-arabinofuranosidase domain-containing protein n=1 Tax=Rheinheimera sp. TaxID=1869214 RepID=UPI002B4907B5|nr:beta-L-arabinofuranosidase domain-containing protein [Rheinheimera sp.]HJS16579.1 beta-L-arabinofuranosidase domain-containing protein [Rheinheimera sp.]